MNDHIIYHKDALDAAAAELDRLADIMSEVVSQLDAVDTSAKWWTKIHGRDGEDAVGEVRALRKSSAGLSSDSAKLAGGVRKTIDAFEELEERVAKSCQTDAPAGTIPLSEAGWTQQPLAGAFGWIGDAIGDYGTIIDSMLDVLRKMGAVGSKFLDRLGPITTWLSSIMSNIDEYISGNGDMSVGRAVSETLVEGLIDAGVGWAIGKGVAVALAASPAAALAVAVGGIVFAMGTSGMIEDISDSFLNLFFKPDEQPETPIPPDMRRKWFLPSDYDPNVFFA